MNSVYLEASANLFPLLGVPNRVLDAILPPAGARPSLEAIFSGATSSVCDLVYGPGLREDLARSFTTASDDANIRKFFEVDNPGTQCKNVIGGVTDDTTCWICSKGVTGMGNPECEHRLAVLLALFVTGLYDSRIAAKAATDPAYKDLLKYEYEWSHNRCNQIKREHAFITFEVSGTGDKHIEFKPDMEAIKGYLTTIITTEYKGYTPTMDTLWTEITKTEPTLTKEAWIERQTKDVAESLRGLLTKLNARAFRPRVLVNRLVSGMLTRAILLAPDLVQKHLASDGPPSLTAEQRALLASRLAKKGGRRKTRHRLRGRKRTHRVYVGGTAEEDELDDALAYLALSLTKAMYLKRLDIDIQRAIDSAKDSFDELPAIAETMDSYVDWTHTVAFESLETALNDSGSLDEFRMNLARAIHDRDPGSVLDVMKPWLAVSGLKRERNAEDGDSTPKRPADADGLARVSPIPPPAPAPAPAPGPTVDTADMQLLTDDEYAKLSGIANRILLKLEGSPPRAAAPAPALGTMSVRGTFGDSESEDEPLQMTIGDVKRLVETYTARGATDVRELEAFIATLSARVQQRGGFKFTMGKRPNWL